MDWSGGAAAVRDLTRTVRGELIRPGDDGYDAARQVWNGRIDRRPMLVVRCADTADVVTAVRYASRHGIELSVRSTGHNTTGWAVSDGGLTIDLSALGDVQVDPAHRTVTAQSGVLWGALDERTQEFGLATTGGRISTTGVAGLTLGGGYGWLMRRYGLAVDNLRAVDLVTADGTPVRASPADNADLFWALRGGGGNFGIATSLEYRLHPVGPRVTGGAAFYPVTEVGRILRWYRKFMAGAPDELSAQCNVLRLPPLPFVPAHLHDRPAVAIAVCHLGSAPDAERDLAPMREIGEPMAYLVRRMRYTTLQRLYDEAGRFGLLVHGRSGHLPALDDAAVDVLAEYAPLVPSPQSIVMLSPLGGAVSRVGEFDTAFGHRVSEFSYSVNAVWREPHDSAAHIGWVERLWAALRPYSAGVYVNELGDEGEARVREAYHPWTWARLRAVKERYDPDNVFRLNQNIPPAQSPQSRKEREVGLGGLAEAGMHTTNSHPGSRP